MEQNDLEYYGRYADMLIDGQKKIVMEVSEIIKELEDADGHSPAEHVLSRIKSSKSIVEKLKKRGYSQDARTGIEQLSDIIGVRIVTHFVGDVYLILERLKSSGCMEITQIKDYIANPKPNGYRSLHVLFKLPVESEDFAFITAEIQIRTVAMDCWASLEHQMKYKKSVKNTELVVSELKRCADEMASTDLTMQTIREMINK